MLRQQHGIHSVSVALLAEKAVVQYDPSRWTPSQLAEEIDDIGFEAEEIVEAKQDEVILTIYGMTCASCSSTIEKEFNSTDGIISISISLATEKAKIHYEKSKLGLRDLIEKVEDLGFEATISDESDKTQLNSLGRVKEVAEWRHAFFFSLGFAIPVFLISMVFMKVPFMRLILNFQPIQGLFLSDLSCLILTIPVQFGIGKRFYVTSYKSLRHGSATMDVLVVMGTTASFVYSTGSMIGALICSDSTCAKPSTFFDTSTMLITFVSFGRYLENAAKGKTSEALSRLIGLTPSSATIYTDGAEMKLEKKIPSELIQFGDYVKVLPGDKIAADGVVVRGESNVDESMVTGESMPVQKVIGASVVGGTVNGNGSFDFKVLRAGKDTSLSQIVRLVEDAQTSKAPIQGFADKAAGIFVPCVLGLGLLTFIAWMVIAHLLSSDLLPDAFQQAGATKLMVCLKLCISVVVVACPCALGLSTPTAVMVGTGVGAQNGILIKGGGPLEASYSIKKIMFDKTGTLTIGKLSVAGMIWKSGDIREGSSSDQVIGGQDSEKQVVAGLTRKEVLKVIGASEGRSEHPLARAVATYVSTSLGQPTDSINSQALVSNFESIPGQGVTCRVTLTSSTSTPDVLSISAPSTPSTSHLVKVGNYSHISKGWSSGWDLPTPLASFKRTEESSAHTVVYVSIDGSLACMLSLADNIKPEARQCIDALRGMGISCGIVTGDTEATALAVARALGINEEDVHAGMSPNGKRSIIAGMRESAISESNQDSRSGSTLSKLSNFLGINPSRAGIGMVGDGINDAPSLASADVGIALCSGADVAMEAASVVLMRTDLLDVPSALHLARRIFFQIKLNFVWATMYNVVGIPLAMGFFLPWGWHLHPMAAGAAMACSSVSVVLSSLTLRWWKRPKKFQWISSSPYEPSFSNSGPSPRRSRFDFSSTLDQGSSSQGLVSVIMAFKDRLVNRLPFGNAARPSVQDGYAPVNMEMA